MKCQVLFSLQNKKQKLESRQPQILLGALRVENKYLHFSTRGDFIDEYKNPFSNTIIVTGSGESNHSLLTVTTLWADSSDNKLRFYLFFLINSFEISYKLSLKAWNANAYFLGKIRKMLSAEIFN